MQMHIIRKSSQVGDTEEIATYDVITLELFRVV